MEILLASDVEDFLRKQVQDGIVSDANELVNDLLRAFRDQRSSPFAVTAELEEWLLEAADQPATPLTSADFDEIRRQARSRFRPAK